MRAVMNNNIMDRGLRSELRIELLSKPFKELEETLEAVFHYLRWYQFIRESEPESSDVKDYRSFEKCFNYAVDELAEEEKRIIEYEMAHRRHSSWWTEYYSRSTYYRLKRNAIVDLILNLKETGNNVIVNILNSKFEGE